jgi:hypothetical protein
MRFIEIAGNLLSPVSNEEVIICEKIRGYNGPFPRTKLTEREQELARGLVIRGILTRRLIDGRIVFMNNDNVNEGGFDVCW